ncbi:MAG: YraN family protein [Chlorobi bacterium]|nr:YraN family protein [Chlorobiota bacterium]
MAEARHIKRGKEGEKLAAEFLENAGFRIIEKNWRFQHLEIDIIAFDGEELVIVEVKTRKKDDPLLPGDLIPPKKQRFIINATDAYIRQKEIEPEVRFDVIIIHTEGNRFTIEHIRKAFYPVL